MNLTKPIDTVSSGYEALLRLSLAINSHLELPVILQQVVHYTCSLVGCEDASIVLWNSGRNQFEMGASTTEVGDKVAKRVRSAGGASRWILDHRQPLIVADAQPNSDGANPMIAESGLRAYAGVPVQQDAELLGVLYALSNRVRTFEHGELETLQNIAGMAAIAIQNAQLIHSLRELNTFKDAMMRMAAHDLRSPLSIAVGYVELLYDSVDSLSPELSDCFRMIRKAHVSMDDLITGILEYERLSAEKELNLERINLNLIAEEVVSQFEETAAEKAQKLTLQRSPQPLVVHCDELLMREALVNLISNAIKYTPPKGRVTVEIESGEEEVLVAVRDTGRGIAASELDELFQPFVRLSSAKNTAGTGLGLSLVKMVVERHGGRVTVESTQGEGSVFRIHLSAAGET